MYLPAFIAAYMGHISYLGIFIILLLANFTPFPEELLILAIGYVSALGIGKIYISIPLTILTLLLGDTILYFLSRRGSPYVEKFERHIMQEKFIKYKKLMEAHMGKTLFISRFLNSFRLLGIFIAGSKGMDIKKFQLYDLAALLIYVPLLIFLGRVFYDQSTMIVGKVEEIRHLPFIFFLIIIGLLGKIFVSNKIYNKRQK